MKTPSGVQIVSELADRNWLMTARFESSSRSAIKRLHSSYSFFFFSSTPRKSKTLVDLDIGKDRCRQLHRLSATASRYKTRIIN